MSFSERHGYKKVSERLIREDIPKELETRIWNIFYSRVFKKLEAETYRYIPPPEDLYNFTRKMWDSFLKGDLTAFDSIPIPEIPTKIREIYYKQLEWYEIFDFIEFFFENFEDVLVKEDVKKELNKVLGEEKSAYRIISNCVVEITSEEEIKEIEKVFEQPKKFEPARISIDKALRHLSNREKPDYENSIKESVSALESLAKILLGQKGTFGDLTNKLGVHQALKGAISKLYGWASDEGGVRHGGGDNITKIGEEEARLTLILSSALINYIIVKYEG